METIKIISVETDLVKSGIGKQLVVPDSIKGKGYYNSRIFASEAEAVIAKGILMLLIERDGMNNEFYSEWEFLLRATLRLNYSTKTWSE